MATFDALFPFSDEAPTKQTIGNGASGAAISVGANRKLMISATGAFHVKFGVTGMGAAAATDFLVPSAGIFVTTTTDSKTHVRIFNDSGASIDVYVQPLGIT